MALLTPPGSSLTRGFLVAWSRDTQYTERMNRTWVLYDGSNVYHKLKRTVPTIHLTTFPYDRFAQMIAKKKQLAMMYYVGEVKKYPGNAKSEGLYAHQQSLLANLRKQSVTTKLGYLLLSDGTYHEKGVDVQIAVDIVRGAIKDEYDRCYLVSSDTDLLPAIKTAQEEGKEIVYVGFENFISRALTKNCSSTVIIHPQDILSL